jgi:OmpA-OmpF porin, OOP family
MAQSAVGGDRPKQREFANNFRFQFGHFAENPAPFLERRNMKKLNKVASLFASAVLAVSVSGAFAQSDNWVDSSGNVWKNGTNQHCWRDTPWTPGTAKTDCDGAIVKPPPAPPPAPVPAPAVVPPPAPPVVPVAPPVPVSEKLTFAADAFFDTGKSVLKPAAKGKLDELITKTKGLNLEVIIAVGHTDSVGSAKSNQKLSVARANAVKKYLVTKGFAKNRVYTEGKGASVPVADNKTKDGKQKNRRVEIEVVGTRAR